MVLEEKEKLRRHPDLNWGMEVLQTSALPLGYAAEAPTLRYARKNLSYSAQASICQVPNTSLYDKTRSSSLRTLRKGQRRCLA